MKKHDAGGSRYWVLATRAQTHRRTHEHATGWQDECVRWAGWAGAAGGRSRPRSRRSDWGSYYSVSAGKSSFEVQIQNPKASSGATQVRVQGGVELARPGFASCSQRFRQSFPVPGGANGDHGARWWEGGLVIGAGIGGYQGRGVQHESNRVGRTVLRGRQAVCHQEDIDRARRIELLASGRSGSGWKKRSRCGVTVGHLWVAGACGFCVRSNDRI